MAKSATEVTFVLPIADIPEKHREAAERKAQEAFVMELLRQADISAGRAARLLGMDRWQFSKLMFEYGISPFDESLTAEDLKREAAALRLTSEREA